jgi:serine/threonine protein kinase
VPDTACPSTAELLQLVRGEVPEPEADRLEEHVLHCSACFEAGKALDGRADTPAAGSGRAATLPGFGAHGPSVKLLIERICAFLPPPASAVADTPAGGAAQTDGMPNDADCGTRIGPYTLLQQVGEGGMGTVWLAEQTSPVRRTVALKVIKVGMDSRQVIARFESERQALAMMEHPNIAKILDAGATESGRPFFVMELVKGVPITEFCDTNHMPVDGRLKLFIDVCHAIQHAHQKGVIHRDVKPSNVLVTLHDGVPVVKVIDFGVAKALAQKLTENTVFTAHGQMIGTPAYMSPEQAETGGLDIDTRSDVFSLGVLLYELLTGTTPLESRRLRDAGYAEMQRLIREQEVPRPSSRLSALGDSAAVVADNRGTDVKRLLYLLAGDLDWIVMKAIDKDRNRRYAAPERFAEDVERYLRRDVVLARPPSTAYKLRKFVRRNRVVVLAAAAVAAALLVGTGIATWQAVRATAAEYQSSNAKTQAETDRDRAVAARARTREALDAMVSTVSGDSLATQTAVSREQKKFLESVLAYYVEFAAEPGEDRAGRERLAHAHFSLGVIRMRLGQSAEGAAIFGRAAQLFGQLAAGFPAVPAFRQNQARSQSNVGLLLTSLGQQTEAEAAYRAALSVREKLAADFPGEPEYRNDLAQGRDNLGLLLAQSGKAADAEAEHRAALAVQEKVVAEFPSVSQYRVTLARCYTSLGVLLSETGRLTAAEPVLRTTLTIREKLAADFPDERGYRNDLAEAHDNLASTLRQIGKGSEAELEYRAALAIEARLVAEFPSVPEYRRALGSSNDNLGGLLGEIGKTAQAEAVLRVGLAVRNQLAADFPEVPSYRNHLGASYLNLGLVLADEGKGADAAATYRSAIAIYEKLVAEFPGVPAYGSRLATAHLYLGTLLSERGNGEDAGPALRTAISINEKLAAGFPTAAEYRHDLADSYSAFAKLCGKLGKQAGAEAAFRKALTLRERLTADFPATPEYRQELIDNRIRLADLLARLGSVSEAVALAEKSVGEPQVPSTTIYDSACVFSQSSAGANNPAADRHAARAIELLRQAIAKGYTDIAHLLTDADLAPLRGRADYADLLWALADTPAPPKKP